MAQLKRFNGINWINIDLSKFKIKTIASGVGNITIDSDKQNALSGNNIPVSGNISESWLIGNSSNIHIKYYKNSIWNNI